MFWLSARRVDLADESLTPLPLFRRPEAMCTAEAEPPLRNRHAFAVR